MQLEIRDEIIKQARGVEKALLGECSTLSDAELIEQFANVGMAKLLSDLDRKEKMRGK